jgi:ubiquinol-cytochrome c reductase cytochrome c1 subunit
MRAVIGAFALALGMSAAGSVSAAEHGGGATWQSLHAGNDVNNLASLQRGARNFLGYCLGCHSLKYQRYSRIAEDLEIPEDQFAQLLQPPGTKPTDYVISSLPAADAEAWFGKAPPDLSLMVRARGGPDYVFQLFKTYYIDPTKPTGVNNLRLAGTAMPHVLSDLEGLKKVVYGKDEHGAQVFERFETVAPGRLSAAEYDQFLRDTVNFLDYVSEPSQAHRRALGVWVVLFLLVFTWLAWLLKKEYWKDVH